ncbi:MAG TPA: phosphotransferase [Symbiobacteriaceae bacterium]|nr:phosphotransferase [Symbiobacteriaceae bacterium]
MDFYALLSHWDLPGPLTLRQTTFGANNPTRLVEGPAGIHVLRVRTTAESPDHVCYEMELLTRIAESSPSFAVPVPILTHTGAPFVELTATGYASLAPLLPGVRPQRGNLSHVRAAGEALGELTAHLSAVTVTRGAPRAWTYGDMGMLRMAPREAVLSLLERNAERAWLDRFFGALSEQVPALYATLPRQIIHGDGNAENLLLQGDRITGIVDFELAAPDLRAMELAIAISEWTRQTPTETLWQAIEVLVRGYARHTRLAPAEITALPTLVRLRRAAVLAFFANRTQGGFPLNPELPDLLREAREADRALTEQGPRLVGEIGEWMA